MDNSPLVRHLTKAGEEDSGSPTDPATTVTDKMVAIDGPQSPKRSAGCRGLFTLDDDPPPTKKADSSPTDLGLQYRLGPGSRSFTHILIPDFTAHDGDLKHDKDDWYNVAACVAQTLTGECDMLYICPDKDEDVQIAKSLVGKRERVQVLRLFAGDGIPPRSDGDGPRVLSLAAPIRNIPASAIPDDVSLRIFQGEAKAGVYNFDLCSDEVKSVVYGAPKNEHNEYGWPDSVVAVREMQKDGKTVVLKGGPGGTCLVRATKEAIELASKLGMGSVLDATINFDLKVLRTLIPIAQGAGKAKTSGIYGGILLREGTVAGSNLNASRLMTAAMEFDTSTVTPYFDTVCDKEISSLDLDSALRASGATEVQLRAAIKETWAGRAAIKASAAMIIEAREVKTFNASGKSSVFGAEMLSVRTDKVIEIASDWSSNGVPTPDTSARIYADLDAVAPGLVRMMLDCNASPLIYDGKISTLVRAYGEGGMTAVQRAIPADLTEGTEAFVQILRDAISEDDVAAMIDKVIDEVVDEGVPPAAAMPSVVDDAEVMSDTSATGLALSGMPHHLMGGGEEDQ